ncbi:hypothetical protein CHS0354_009898 [Potamilus streckersoni]|uniref:Uncharacterized protein n=1 Tax=Potamilus streckersoni TaxID=2493646 RepID=A0AAE0S4I3_9BIVA|nr:hypothetical protein CHS0354_009898 [Potamilus streckersoni]
MHVIKSKLSQKTKLQILGNNVNTTLLYKKQSERKSTSFEILWLKDVTARFQTDKRTLIDVDFPNDLTFHLTRGSESLTLNLKRNHDINPYADVYFARKLKDGQPVLVKSRNYHKEVSFELVAKSFCCTSG